MFEISCASFVSLVLQKHIREGKLEVICEQLNTC